MFSKFPLFTLVAMGLLGSACASNADSPNEASTSSPLETDCGEGESIERFRTDLSATGNRVAVGRGSLLSSDPTDIELPGVAEWIVPFEVDEAGVSWFVELRSGQSVLVDPNGGVTTTEVELDGEPPEVRVASSRTHVVSAYDEQSMFPDILADSRVVTDGDISVALVSPSDQYDHAILGDRFEAKAFEVFNRCTGERTRTSVASEDVIEGLSAMLADIDGDGALDVLVTISNSQVGSRLSAFEFDGTLIAESEPIGQGGRWRNQLAVAPVGPDGEIEIVDVRKPHATGEVEYFRLVEGSLVVVAQAPGFTSHVIRTQNLDKGIVADADGDGHLDVIVLNFGRTELDVLSRVGDEVQLVGVVALNSEVSSNISAAELPIGTVSFAVGTEDGRFRIWN